MTGLFIRLRQRNMFFFIIFCLCTFQYAESADVLCQNREVRCNGTATTCISLKYMCDLINDCPDGEDEFSCGVRASGCGDLAVHTGVSGTLSSMNYPGNYYNNSICKWRIQVLKGQTISIQFDNLFDLEKPRGGKCAFDRVDVLQDGPYTSIGSYCGASPPPKLEIPTDSAVVEFHSDKTITGQGFKLTWIAVDIPPPPTEDPTERGLMCAEVVDLGGTHGEIDSPILEDVVAGSPQIQCRWQIRVKSGQVIHLTFKSFYMGNPCEEAKVIVYDGPDSNGSPLASVCGNSLPADIVSTSNSMFISMNIADNDRSNKWFTAAYKATQQEIGKVTPGPSGCDGVPVTIRSTEGWISSPNFDGVTPYQKNVDCQWNFVAPPATTFVFSFNAFAVEKDTTCQYDYLKISEETAVDGFIVTKELQTLCGYYLPFDVSSSSYVVTLKFHSDQINQFAGFNVTYKTQPRILPCSKYELQCRSGKCINKMFVCNGFNDCLDGSDEMICPQSTTCGMSTFPPRLHSARIVGGGLAVKDSWPWMLSIVNPATGRHDCGATLIHPQWALTAAHCFKNATSRTYDGYTLMAGRYQLTVPDRNEQSREVDQVFIADDFNLTTLQSDIALVRLKQPFQMTDYVKPVCLPNTMVQDGTYGWILGWGETYNATCCQHRLKQAAVPVIAQSVCRQTDYYGGRRDISISDNMMCAGYAKGGTDSCKGDSGGPFITRRPTTGQWELQGVTSAGTACAAIKKPGIYMRVYDFLPWIQQTVSSHHATARFR